MCAVLKKEKCSLERLRSPPTTSRITCPDQTGVLHAGPCGDNRRRLMNLPFTDTGSIGGEVHTEPAETGTFFNVRHVQHRAAPGPNKAGGRKNARVARTAVRFTQQACTILTTSEAQGLRITHERAKMTSEHL